MFTACMLATMLLMHRLMLRVNLKVQLNLSGMSGIWILIVSSHCALPSMMKELIILSDACNLGLMEKRSRGVAIVWLKLVAHKNISNYSNLMIRGCVASGCDYLYRLNIKILPICM